MRKLLALLVLVAACGTDGPPTGRYRIAWESTGDGCDAGTLADTLDVNGATLTWRWTGPGVPADTHVDIAGNIDGACVNVPADGEWQAFAVCSDGDDAIDAALHNVASTCGRRMTGTR